MSFKTLFRKAKSGKKRGRYSGLGLKPLKLKEEKSQNYLDFLISVRWVAVEVVEIVVVKGVFTKDHRLRKGQG